MRFQAGTRFGPYEIVGPLGAGGMGEVYRARDPRIGREVAVKVLRADYAADPGRLRRFEHEARSAGALNHPNILALYDLGTQEGTPYLVTELLDGESLRSRLAGGPLPQRKAVDYGIQIARGLSAAHERGIVHRDLKPENVFLTRGGRVKILDFGLAKLTQPEPTAEASQIATLTALSDVGVVLGTVGYMSPEQVHGMPVDARSDLFSFGAVLYEMLSGTRAFHGASPADTMSAILSRQPPELASETPPIPLGVQRIVEHCLEKDPEQRFQTARDIAFALEALSGGSGTAAAHPAAGAFLTRRGLLAGLGSGLLIGGLGAAGTYFLGRQSARRQLPSFRALTFSRGTVTGARFTPDGKTAVYSAAWGNEPSRIYSMFLESPEARSLELANAMLLSVSPRGELAVLLTEERNPYVTRGILARVPLAGGAPRQVLEDVVEADWGPDGESLCVSRWVNDQLRLEYPIGKVLLETETQFPRVSPRGDRIAFTGDEGIEVMDLEGKNHVVLTPYPPYLFGLAWGPDGSEIWFTAGETATNRALHAITMEGEHRLLARAPGSFTIEDVSMDGRALLTLGFGRWGVLGFPEGESAGRELGIFSRSALSALSTDGRKLLIADWSRGSGPDSPVYLRDMDGSPPVRLGEGAPLALSPDGRWALCVLGSPTTPASPPRFVELPTGPGEARSVDLGSLEPGGGEMRGSGWSLDGRRLFVAAREKGRRGRIFVREGQSGAWRPVTPEGVAGPFVASPDGARVAARPPGASVTLYPADGGSPRELAGERGVPIHWSADRRFLYLREAPPRKLPETVAAYDLETGERRPWKTLMPPDPAGVTRIDPVLLSGDASAYAYSYSRTLTELYLAEGLR